MGYRKQPFGYRMENGKIVIHPQEADMVKNVFRDYLAGMGFVALAEKLNGRGIQYYPGKLWNKNMLARLLEDDRYIGSGAYPAIISEKTLTAAAALRGEKTTPCGTTAVQKTLRRLCGYKPSKSAEIQVLCLMNLLIKDPTLIRCPELEHKSSVGLFALKSQLDELLDSQPVDESRARPLIFQLAATQYQGIGNEECETERLRDIFAQMTPICELDAGLLKETIAGIRENHNGMIQITLKNGQSFERGETT